MTFSEKISTLRALHELTQSGLAEAIKDMYGADISREDIANWEIGRHAPGWIKAKHLVNYFGITLDDLFYENKTEFLKNYNPKKLKRAKRVTNATP